MFASRVEEILIIPWKIENLKNLIIFNQIIFLNFFIQCAYPFSISSRASSNPSFGLTPALFTSPLLFFLIQYIIRLC